MENNNNNAPKKLSQSTNGLNGAKVQPGSPSASPKTPVGVQKKPFESQKGVDKRMNKMFEETKQPTLGQWDGKGSDPVKVEFNPNLNKTKEINSKITKQMGLSENDLEPIDQSPLYKAKYDEKNGHLPKDEARVKANKNKFDISKYPDVEKTPYGFIYNVNGESITDLKEQDRKFGRNVDDNKNYGFTVTKDGDEVYYETFEDAYNAAKGINSNDDDEEKEYDNIDDDYERSYGPVTNDKEYQAYLKWKENGDSFDNIGDKIRNQMGISEEEWNEPYNDGMVNIDKGKPRISNANLTTAFVDGKISGKEYYKEVNDRIKENNRKMQLMTSQVPYNGLDAKSKEEYDRIKEQNDEWNFIIDEYDLDNKYADSKVLNQMGLGNEDDIEDKAMEIVSNEGRNAFKSFLNGQLTDEQYEKNVKDKLMSELGVDEQQAQDLWNKYGGYLGGGLNPMNEEQKAAALNQMGISEEDDLDSQISDIETRLIDLENHSPYGLSIEEQEEQKELEDKLNELKARRDR